MTQKVKSAKKFFQHYSHLNGISVQMRQALKGKKERIFFKEHGNYFIHLTKWKIKF